MVLPSVLAVVVLLALLSALALIDATQEWRVAGLADDAVRARAAAIAGLASLQRPPDLALLCVSGPMAAQEDSISFDSGARVLLRWRALGDGVVRSEVDGWGRQGARHRLQGLLVPDSVERSMGLLRCPAATRLVPVPGRWLEGLPGA